MAKSIRSKKEKRLKAIRRELVEPFYEKKDEAKLAALQAALAAPKLPVNPRSSSSSSSAMDAATVSPNTCDNNMSNPNMDVEMADDDQTKSKLKPIGKKLKKKFKLGRNKGRGKGKFKKRHI